MIAVADIAQRLRQTLELARLSPFNTATAEGRSKERHRRMLISTLTSALAKAVSIATALISVPLTLHYLGPERYGMWLTISSFIAILSFADLGLGNGLLNRVAAAHGKDDRATIRRYVSSGFGMLSLIATVILVVFATSFRLVPWDKLFNLSDPLARSEAGPAMAVFIGCFALSIPAAIVQKVQAGLQNGFLASLWQCLGSVLALGGIIVATHFRLGLPWLVLAFVGAPLIAAILNSLVFFRMQPDIAPSLSDFSIEAARHTAKTGLLFLLLQVVAAASYSSDPLIIAHLLGPAAVPQYSVPERMFSLVGMVIAMGLAPLWPAYGEAISRADHKWVRQTLVRSLCLSVGLAAVGSSLIAFAGPTLLRFWVGSAIHATPALLAGLAIWKVIEAGGNSIAMFLNGAHVVRFQVILSSITGAAILGLKFFLVGIMGVPGTVWATIIGFSLFAVVPLLFRVSKIVSATGGIQNAAQP